MRRICLNERGSGTLVTAMWSIVLLLVILSGVFDITKNFQMKNIQNSVAQAAAEAGIKKIDRTGSLDALSVEEAIRTYKLERSKNNSEFTAYSQNCSTVKVNGVEHEVPYFEFYLTKERGDKKSSGALVKVNGDKATVLTNTFGKGFKVLNMKVYDSVDNFALSAFGMPCQELVSDVKAIAFASQSDIGSTSGSVKANE